MKHLWRKLLKSKMAKITPTVGQFKQEPDPLFDNLTNNENKFRSIYKDCSDVIFRPFFIGGKDKSILLYIEGLSNIEEIDDNVLSPLMQNTEEEFYNVNSLIEKKISVSNVKEIKTFSECIQEISSGNPVILVDKRKTGFSLGLSKWEKRSVEEPSAEMVVRGPREAFVETLRVNTSLLRRKIRSPELKMQSIEIGRYTKTKVVITYMEGIADRTLIEETQNRLSRIGKCFRNNLSDFLVLVIIHDRPPDYDEVVLFAGELWDTLIISRGLFVLKSQFHSLQECCPVS
ncbi:spore germination protein [Peribacillus sp. R9-11]|uniref:spore germination protein n=1 Tax=Peribacillus sp. R9-11 TaxID=3073271 RepID=UPI0028695206|nr:spore germination protein [Peribacillus sp. R9-11]WMX58849.1 spore germination protein [Peribacillus sp. R9-11]